VNRGGRACITAVVHSSSDIAIVAQRCDEAVLILKSPESRPHSLLRLSIEGQRGISCGGTQSSHTWRSQLGGMPIGRDMGDMGSIPRESNQNAAAVLQPVMLVCLACAVQSEWHASSRLLIASKVAGGRVVVSPIGHCDTQLPHGHVR